ncbi:hypothetical protein QJS04_geneDACA009624 [Acorus gramineus]|uniref:Uncharacterized protein n=1 Tax=Acorus gramineus TaxID=55184 RepID=A0AAV9BDD3_ACOGR|nr:hypothetical protein QJS04_geneDACA009624 [Acorus gramineus]
MLDNGDPQPKSVDELVQHHAWSLSLSLTEVQVCICWRGFCERKKIPFMGVDEMIN